MSLEQTDKQKDPGFHRGPFCIVELRERTEKPEKGKDCSLRAVYSDDSAVPG